ncbi:MAG: alpha/beta hydrolase, partial [Sphingomonas parapaucimobilis]
VQGPGDGWRFADLPPDPEAWRQGLLTLDTLTGGFTALDHQARSEWLDRIAAGGQDAAVDTGPLSPKQMALWFQDVRAEVVRQWAALPSTMAAIGYDGFAVGGDGPRNQGYRRTGANDVEAWQMVEEKIA